LLRWFSEHSQPELAHSTNNHSKASNPNYPLFFGNGGSYILASGRCEIVRALAEGYLRQEPPNLGGWAEFIKSQLGIEPHPAVWVDIVAGMGALLGGDRADATELLDQVIQNCPGVLLKAAEDVVEIIEMDQLVETHSDIVVKVCRSLIDAWAELASTSYATARVAERIIPISIQLHRLRLPQCREAGLRIFEDLMSLNPQEIKAALEVLDRKPNRSGYFLTRNRKIRSRQQ
jgi:hypothetical protein